MPSSDDQHRLNARQRREIDQIGQKFHFNLAPPPSSLDEITTGPKFVSLTDFIEQFDWEYSDLDIVDRREIKHLAADNFWRYIGKSEVPLEEPGHLSAVTVAKGIEYGVNLLGCFIEGYVGSNQTLGKEAEAHLGCRLGPLTKGVPSDPGDTDVTRRRRIPKARSSRRPI